MAVSSSALPTIRPASEEDVPLILSFVRPAHKVTATEQGCDMPAGFAVSHWFYQ